MTETFETFPMACAFALACDLTPLQRKEIQSALRTHDSAQSNDEGDNDALQRQRQTVYLHFQSLHADFHQSFYRKRMIRIFAVTFFILVAAEHENVTNVLDHVPNNAFVLASGDSIQREEAAAFLLNGNLSKLDSFINDVTVLAVRELLLDGDHVHQRMRAACANTNLTAQLQQAGHRTELTAIVAHDESALQNIGSFIKQYGQIPRQQLESIEQFTAARIRNLRDDTGTPEEQPLQKAEKHPFWRNLVALGTSSFRPSRRHDTTSLKSYLSDDLLLKKTV